MRHVALAGLSLTLLASAFGMASQKVSYTDLRTGPAQPVLVGGGKGAWDEFVREKVAVIQDGAIFRMWYVGHDAEGQASSKVGYATSPDGITWTRHAGNPVISRKDVKDQDVSVVRGPDGKFWMYIEVNDSWIDLFTSSDGVRWTADSANPVKTTAASPVVWREDAAWYLMYENMNGPIYNIHLATSTDGRKWIDSPANPVLADRDVTVPDAVVKEGTRYHLYYHTGNNGTWHAASENLTTWGQRNRLLDDMTSPFVFVTASGELWAYLWEHDGKTRSAPSRYYLRRSGQPRVGSTLRP
jgi:hypothetical protein